MSTELSTGMCPGTQAAFMSAAGGTTLAAAYRRSGALDVVIAKTRVAAANGTKHAAGTGVWGGSAFEDPL